MPHLPSLTEQSTLIDVYKKYPAVAQAALALNDAIMRQEAPFSPAQREAIAAYVSSINACQYCMNVHTSAATGLGMDAGEVAAVCERPEAPDDPRLVPVLRYVAKLTTEPASVTEADAKRILDAGWDEAAVSYAAFVAALYAFMNRLIEGHGIKGDPAQLAVNGNRLAEIGYTGLAAILAEAEGKD